MEKMIHWDFEDPTNQTFSWHGETNQMLQKNLEEKLLF